MIRPGSQSAFQLIPNVFDGVEVRAQCMPVKFFHTNLDKPLPFGPFFVQRDIVMLKQERAFPKLLETQNCKVNYIQVTMALAVT